MKARIGNHFFWFCSTYLILNWWLSTGPGLESSHGLTYHEAFVAQGAREILASGRWWYPAIGGRPWLEKPPLPFWLVAALGRCTGQVRPIEARLPSSIAALGLVLGVSLLATHRFGPVTGLLAGAIQATTAWAVLRGRLAEADILLACVITWTVVAFDRLRAVPGTRADTGGAIQGVYSLSFWQWTFFGLLGVLSLIKGIGFGAVLVLSIVLPVVFWDRDSRLTSQLCTPLGWGVVGVLTMAWPLAMIREHGDKAISLWLLHVVDRISTSTTHKVFASESWPEYCLNILGQGLPWTPLAIISMYASGSRVLGPGTSRNARKVRQPITNPQRGEPLALGLDTRAFDLGIRAELSECPLRDSCNDPLVDMVGVGIIKGDEPPEDAEAGQT